MGKKKDRIDIQVNSDIKKKVEETSRLTGLTITGIVLGCLLLYLDRIKKSGAYPKGKK